MDWVHKKECILQSVVRGECKWPNFGYLKQHLTYTTIKLHGFSKSGISRNLSTFHMQEVKVYHLSFWHALDWYGNKVDQFVKHFSYEMD